MATMIGRGGRGSYIAGIAAGLFLAGVGTASAQTTVAVLPTGTAHVIEWDLSSMQLDGNPGAMVVDTRGEDRNRVWFITRLANPAGETDPTQIASPQRIYRFDPSTSLYKAAANWSSWELRGDIFGGGITRIRPSHDRRFVFARTTSFVQRVDTQNCTTGTYPTCERTVYSYPDEQPLSQNAGQNSDIAVDDMNRIFTSGVSPSVPFDAGYVQMIDPAAKPTVDSFGNLTITVKRWPAPGAGLCIANGAAFICNSGIDIHPSKQYLVYYTEPNTNNIVELNVNNSNPSYSNPNVRRWSLTALGASPTDPSAPEVFQPRSLKIDRRGRVWVNTGSGHLVSLDPSTSRMTKHPLPDGVAADPWGVAPDDDVIGYTSSNTNKVAMLFPKFQAIYVPPTPSYVMPQPFTVIVEKEPANRVVGTAPADAKVVATDTAACNGTCVEADVSAVLFTTNKSAAPSLSPLGISPNMSKAQGTFFYTVGLTAATDPATGQPFSVAKRLGFVRLPNKERIRFARDDDDADDGFDRTKDARWHNSEPGDADADGVPDQYDTNTTTDNMTIADLVVVPVGQSSDYPASTSATTLALIASVTPDVATATIAVDVYNSIGTLVGTSGPIVGAGLATIPTPGAGNYKIRVRNLGTTSVTPTPTIVVREPLVQQ
jgi:streptogramin lyase